MADTQGLLEIGKFTIEIVGGGGALAAVLVKLGRMTGTFEEVSRQQTQEIAEINEELKQLREVVTTVAVQKVEMDNLQSQITMLTKWYDELRHGKGYVSNGG